MRDTNLERVYGTLVERDEDHGCGALPEEACREVPGNATKQISALTLQSAADHVVDAKTVLAWLLAALGAPAGLTGLLVPIRESGSLLPQASLVPWVRRFAVRKWLWVLGAVGQASAVAVMALIAAVASGAAAGLGILTALGVLALFRSVSSIASKDVLGRTVPKGQRGQITGLATVVSGVMAVTVGLAIRGFGGEGTEAGAFLWLLGAAVLAWLAAGGVFARIVEPADTEEDTLTRGWLGHAVTLLRQDAAFRRFVIVRTLLLVSALSPPFVVTLAAREVGAGLGQLGPFVAATGLASMIGGPVWGRLADRSSRRVMMTAAGGASATVVALLLLTTVERVRSSGWLYPVFYLLLALAHTGVRVGRKTYVVDLAEGNRRTDYVATSNTAMGGLLLLTGGLSAALAGLGIEVALVFLAILGAAGAATARTLPEVTARTS